MPVRIVADIQERRSGVPALLAHNGVDVEVGRLDVGDYALPGGGLVERKTVRGLHTAVIDGTFWPLLGRLRQAARFSYVLIEGRDLDDGPLSPAAIRGVWIALLDLAVGVVRSTSPEDSALWLHRLADRRSTVRSRDRPAYAQRPKRQLGAPAAEAVLGCVPGISNVLARALLSRFGSVARVVEADPREWQRVPGIGPHKAKALARTFGLPH